VTYKTEDSTVSIEQAIQQILADGATKLAALVLFPVVLIAIRGIVGARVYDTPAIRRVTRQSHIYNK
jgi:hypothetical protein